MSQIRSTTRRWRSSVAALLVLLASGTALAETQALHFPTAPAWYFVSLQIDPSFPDPMSVFSPGAGFEYDHVWSYDAADGWRHFSPPSPEAPPPGVLGVVNDLERIEPLRGYWIHVTSIPDSSFALFVDGSSARTQRLIGAGWHAAGPLLPPGAGATSVSEVFEDLGTSTPDILPEVWRHGGDATGFARITEFSASCVTAPDECLEPGHGYWLRTTADIALGKEFAVSPSSVLLSGRSTRQLVEISYSGGSLSGAAGSLRPDRPDTGLRFLPARTIFVDGNPRYEPDLEGGSVDGPALEADLDGDGVPEPCPDLCGGATDCVDLCFDNSTQSHRVYVEMDADRLVSLEEFSSLEPGRELTFLELEVEAQASAAPEIVARVPLAVKPPVVSGEWSGALYYDGAQGRIPMHVFMEDCTLPSNGGSARCDGSILTAVINPTIVGEGANGIDDDRDGDIDEPSEEGRLFGMREGLGFPGDVLLRGNISGGNAFIRLEGEVPEPVSPEETGVAVGFAGGTRRLALEGFRSGPTRFSGTFVDDRSSDLLGRVVASGTFELMRVVAGQCVAPSAIAARPLGIECRADGDCASRCTGGTRKGFLCDLANADPSDDCPGASCEPYSCSLRRLGGASAGVTVHEPVSIDITGVGGAALDELGTAIVEVIGAGITQVVNGAGGFVLDEVPCSEDGRIYEVRVTAPGCRQTQTTVVDACAGATVPIELVCEGPSVAGSGGAPAIGGGGITLVGGVVETGATPHLIHEGGADCDLYGPCTAHWESSDGTPLSPVLRTGVGPGDVSLLAAGGDPAVAGPDLGRGWSDRLRWPPLSELRAGLLALLPELDDEEL